MILNTVRSLLEEALFAIQHRRANTKAIRGVVVTGQMHGVLLVDSDNRPRSNLLTWRDRRATKSSLLQAIRANDAGNVVRKAGHRCQHGGQLVRLGYTNSPMGRRGPRVLACTPVHAGTYVVNVGTGSQISIVQRESESARGLEIRPLLPRYFILAGTGVSGGWSYEYLARFFQSVIESFRGAHMPMNHIYRTMNEAGGSEAQDADGLTVDPSFLGSRSDNRATGSILRIDEGNLRPSSLIRATANGIVDELFGYFAQVDAHPQRLFMTGNASRRIPMLREAVRDRWGKDPVVINHEQDAALGAAYLAAVNLDLIDRSWLLGE